jgi:hypothetical protein
VSIYQSIRRNIPEGLNLQQFRCATLKTFVFIKRKNDYKMHKIKMFKATQCSTYSYLSHAQTKQESLNTERKEKKKSRLYERMHFGEFVWEYRNHQAAISRELRVAVKWDGRYNVLSWIESAGHRGTRRDAITNWRGWLMAQGEKRHKGEPAPGYRP